MSFRAWRAEGRGDFTDVIWHLFLNGSTSSCLPVSYATTRQKFAGWMATSKRAGFVAIFLHITIKWPVLLLVREGSGHKNIGNILIFKWKQRECFAFAKLLKHFPRFLSRYPLSVSRFYVPLHPSVPLLPRERFLSRYPLSVSRFYVPLHPSVPLLPRERLRHSFPINLKSFIINHLIHTSLKRPYFFAKQMCRILPVWDGMGQGKYTTFFDYPKIMPYFCTPTQQSESWH